MKTSPDYAAAETAAYEVLLRHGQPLPVRPMALLQERARVVSYEDAAEMLGLTRDDFDKAMMRVDAFTVHEKGVYMVCYRADGNPARRNFTLAHELGHIALDHGEAGPAEEKEADHFASCLLMPEPVRRRIALRGDLTAEDAAALCYMSVTAAQMAMKRRPTEADEALLAALDELFSAQVEAAKPDAARLWPHELPILPDCAKKS